MAESMMSTPNLEGGTSTSDLVTAWSMIAIKTNETIMLPFDVKHLYWFKSTGVAWRSPLYMRISEMGDYPSIDIIDVNPLSLYGTNGWESHRFTLSGRSFVCDQIYTTEAHVDEYVHFFIAVPA